MQMKKTSASLTIVILLTIMSLAQATAIIPDPSDTTAPIVTVSVTPSNPNMYDTVTITVNAFDASPIENIDIQVDGEQEAHSLNSNISFF